MRRSAARTVWTRARGWADLDQPSGDPRQAAPRRSRRRALDDREIAQLIDAVRTTSNDPDLDLLVVHPETGARREGALNLRRRDLDPDRATVWLREKGDSEREQPWWTPRRPGSTHPQRHTDLGSPLRHDLQPCPHLPSLRHTAITAVGRLAGYPVAQASAGHTPPSVTGRYLHATLTEIAAAVAILTGRPHSLAPPMTGRCAADVDGSWQRSTCRHPPDIHLTANDIHLDVIVVG